MAAKIVEGGRIRERKSDSFVEEETLFENLT
jgi:hypothetical protein